MFNLLYGTMETGVVKIMDLQYLILDTCVISELLYRNNSGNYKLNNFKEITNGKGYIYSITIFTLFELIKQCKDKFNKKYIQDLVSVLNLNKVELFNYSYFQKYSVPKIYKDLYNGDEEYYNNILEELYNDDKNAKSQLISNYFIGFAFLYLIIEMYSVISDKEKMNNKYKLVNWFGINWVEQFGPMCLSRVKEMIDSAWENSYTKKEIRDESNIVLKEFIGICLYIDSIISRDTLFNPNTFIDDMGEFIDFSLAKTDFNKTLTKLSELKKYFHCNNNNEVLRILISDSLKFQHDFLKEPCYIYMRQAQ